MSLSPRAAGGPERRGDDQRDARQLVGAQRLAEYQEARERGHRWLEAHQYAKRAGGDSPQHLELDRVGWITLAVRRRSRTAPPGPARANIVVASAAPIWTEAMAPTTSAGEGTPASASPQRAAMDGDAGELLAIVGIQSVQRGDLRTSGHALGFEREHEAGLDLHQSPLGEVQVSEQPSQSVDCFAGRSDQAGR